MAEEVIFRIVDDDDPQYIEAILYTDDWSINFHLSYLNWSLEDFELYGDEPKFEYYCEEKPDIPLDEKSIYDMVLKSKWK